jgi:pyrimidine-nucleoside phosphorylase
VLGTVASDRADAEQQVRRAIASGAGLERFRQIVEAQHGDPAVVDDYRRLPSVVDRHIVTAPRSGHLAGLNAELIGRASVALGAGRNRIEDAVDPAVGIMLLAKPGDPVRAGDGVLELHYRDRAKLEAAVGLALRAILVSEEPPLRRPLIVGEAR